MPKIDLHIISFNIPYPANYGGIIDVFYKLKCLSETGLKIHLHCYQYGREQHLALNEFATKVSYYKRPKSVFYHFSSKPYIVGSRQSKQLINNLLNDDAPILFEGIHTCAFLNDNRLKNRLKIVRTHNIEHLYYEELCKRTSNIIKKSYYKIESLKLKKFEKVLEYADALISISKTDFEYFNSTYGKTHFIPPFHSSNECILKSGSSDYALFQGNLSVPENYQMVVWIIENIFSKIDKKLIIAGFKPSKSILKAACKNKNITVTANPSDDQMRELISNAHLNLLFTQQSTGLKLKLLNALFNGRFCLCNSKMLEGTGIQNSIHLVNIENTTNCIHEIESIFNKSFTNADINSRIEEVNVLYNNSKNTQILMEILSLHKD